jgi:hypothetical protein
MCVLGVSTRKVRKGGEVFVERGRREGRKSLLQDAIQEVPSCDRPGW